MRYTHRAVGRIDRLPAMSTGAIHINLEVFIVNHDLIRCINLRQYFHERKAGLSQVITIERTQANQAVNTIL
ncbi:hypothetical protein D3C85_1388430 [compost metagenome]